MYNVNLMKKFFFLFSIIGIIQSCTPKVSSSLSSVRYDPLDKTEEIYIIPLKENEFEGSDYIGEIKIGDSGFSTDCGYNKVMEELKKMARIAGANIVQLTFIRPPNMGSTCYRINAKMYRSFDNLVLAEVKKEIESISGSRLPEGVDYAIVHFYRPRRYQGSLVGFKIRNKDTVLGRAHNGAKFEFKTSEYGMHTFFGSTESEASIKIDIQKGQEYFVRCGIKMGVAVGKPVMELVDNSIGIDEMLKMKS